MVRSADLEGGHQVKMAERGCDEAAGVLLAGVPSVARWRTRVRRVWGVVVVSWRPKHIIVVDGSALRAYTLAVPHRHQGTLFFSLDTRSLLRRCVRFSRVNWHER